MQKTADDFSVRLIYLAYHIVDSDKLLDVRSDVKTKITLFYSSLQSIFDVFATLNSVTTFNSAAHSFDSPLLQPVLRFFNMSQRACIRFACEWTYLK